MLRNFVTRAEAIGMEYNIVEAIDQPWKYFEGGVGPYWGILNAAREPKFSWTGPIVNPDYWKLATIALLVGVLLSLPILRLAEPTVMQALLLSAAANGVGAWVGDRVRLLGRPLLRVRLGLRADARPDPAGSPGPDRDGADRGDRGGRLRPRPAPADRQGRDVAPATHGRGLTFPKVSIHVPAYFEPPEMLKQTLDALAAARLSEFRMRRHHQQHA